MSLNARADIVHDGPDYRVIRVYPDGVKVRFSPGQYGSLGLPSEADPAKLLKRAYSVSSPLLDEKGELVDANELPYYEFFFNRVAVPEGGKERLTPKLFALKDGDRIFCGTRFSGHYTLEKAPRGKNLLLIATTTGEAPHNAILAEFLSQGRGEKVCSMLAAPEGWESPYGAAHRRLQKDFSSYKRLDLRGPDYSSLEALISRCLKEESHSLQALGFPLRSSDCQVFLCGDPAMIGAPEKLGAWNYESRQGGLFNILTRAGFEAGTRFKGGNLEHESYW